MLYRQESGNAELDPAAGETLADAKLSDYIMRRDRASRWKNVCGMSSAEIDMLLGHKINGVNTYMHATPCFISKRERYAFVHLLNISQMSCADVAATLFLRLFEAAFFFFCAPIL